MLKTLILNLGTAMTRFILRPGRAKLSTQGSTHNSAMTTNDNQSIVWIDLEMTGLDVFKDQILEIACLVTDEQLNIRSTDFHLIVHQPEEVLKSMHKWCVTQHKLSGLTEASEKSTVGLEEAEQRLLRFLAEYVPEKTCPLAGNSIYMDRLFLRRYMPIVDEYLHYRIIDVSTISELARRWNPPVVEAAPRKGNHHRAIEDIRESINQLKYYKQNFFHLLN